jgi:hypothetical protein
LRIYCNSRHYSTFFNFLGSQPKLVEDRKASVNPSPVLAFP